MNISNDIPLVLVDGNNLLWRAVHGFPARIKSKTGTDITGVFGFFALLGVAVREIGLPAEWIVLFDGQKGHVSRETHDNGYKGNRLKEVPEVFSGLHQIKHGLSYLKIPWEEYEDYEADDVIATTVAQNSLRRTFIFSTDKDFYQLISNRVFILNTMRPAGQRILDREYVVRRFEVSPQQWCSFRALTGDSSDNLKGVPGIGPKRAAKLLQRDEVTLFAESGDNETSLSGEHWTRFQANVTLMRLRADLAISNVAEGTLLQQWRPTAEIMRHLGIW
jgi:DNA polymerase I